MYIVFRNTKRGENDDLSDSTVKILYSVFLGAILVGIVILMLLKVPEPASGVPVPKKDHVQMISKGDSMTQRHVSYVCDRGFDFA